MHFLSSTLTKDSVSILLGNAQVRSEQSRSYHVSSSHTRLGRMLTPPDETRGSALLRHALTDLPAPFRSTRLVNARHRCAETRVSCHAAAGTVVIGWSTGNGTIVNNKQAPYYPNATIYAPQTPDPASYNSTVGAVPMFAQSWKILKILAPMKSQASEQP